jgi:hypothetical protein
VTAEFTYDPKVTATEDMYDADVMVTKMPPDMESIRLPPELKVEKENELVLY